MLRDWLKKNYRYYRMFGWRGPLFLAHCRRLSPGTLTQLTPPGFSAPLWLRWGTADFGFHAQIFANHAYALNLLHPPRVIVDAGANIGLAAVYFANRYPAARILAIEPESANYELLARNTAAYPQIVPIRAALWSEDAELSLVDPGRHHGAYRTEPATGLRGAPLIGKVPGIPLARLLADHGVSYVDILKVDIEGAEKEVFAHAAAWIDRVGIIVAELHDWIERGCALRFYSATQAFEHAWCQGENAVVARTGLVEPPCRAATPIQRSILLV